MSVNKWNLLTLNIARIWSILSLVFLIYMLAGHILAEFQDSPDKLTGGLNSSREWILFICFPISTLVGLAVAWRFEALGGLIAVVGMVGLFVLRPDLIMQPVFLILPAPAFLFLAHWVMERNQPQPNNQAV